MSQRKCVEGRGRLECLLLSPFLLQLRFLQSQIVGEGLGKVASGTGLLAFSPPGQSQGAGERPLAELCRS